MKCPKCGIIMYRSRSGIDICPGCGFGSPSIAQKIDEIAAKEKGKTAPISIVKGAWRFNIYFRFRGSKSEGQHGILLHNGKPLEPEQVGDVIDTDLGKMKYYCDLEDMEVPFEPTGWNFEDRTKIKPSWILEESTHNTA